VFGTRTKDTGYEAVGLELVAAAARIAAGRLPIVAIGGITLPRACEVMASGASAVAVIGDLLATGHPASRVAEYVRLLEPGI
jgi:thiamine-phosphate pyrophosphorylase